MRKRITHVIANGTRYVFQKKGVQREGYIEGVEKPYCYFKKLSHGRIQIDYYEDFMYENNPNKTIIAYPSGIQEIGYEKID